MIRRFWLACACVLAFASPSVAQIVGIEVNLPVPGCGGDVTGTNSSGQFGVGRWLQYHRRHVDRLQYLRRRRQGGCLRCWRRRLSPASDRHVGRDGRKQVPVPFDGAWITNGNHGFILVGFPYLYWATGGTQSAAMITNVPEPEPIEPDPEEECLANRALLEWVGLHSAELSNPDQHGPAPTT